MSLTRVQTAPKASGQPATITFSTPPTVGNAIIVASIAWGASAPAPSATDNRGNTYTSVLAVANGSPRVAFLYCPKIVATGAPFTITLNYTGQYATAIEVTGLGSDSLLLDQTASQSSGGSSSTTPSTGVTPPITGTDAFAVIAHSLNSSEASITVGAATPAWTQDLEDLSWSWAAGEID